MPKGQFIVMKTGTHPMIQHLKLYFKWGIRFEEPYHLPDRGARKVCYMDRVSLMRKADAKYPKKQPVLPDESTDGQPRKLKVGTEETDDYTKADL